ncbi:MAG TPA: indolepyruvate oxidoreductase subunit beta [Fimbriimonadaceae bacterium]|nr:indolepyruvate oxidoreductase subunit beta [Fimbriimonadaceae bacterium]
MRHDIIIAGVGGQGILTIARVLSMAALARGLHVKQAEVHGMSQRGGAVYSHLRISDEELFSDLIPSGQADMILAIEPLEALRYVQMLREDGIVVASTNAEVNITDYPAIEGVLGHIAAFKNHVAIDMEKLARAAGGVLAANIVALGAASTYLGFTARELESAIEDLFARKGERVVETNIRAFRFGRTAAAAYLEAIDRGASPESIRGWISTLSAEHLASAEDLDFSGLEAPTDATKLSGAEAHAFESLLMGAYDEGRKQLYEHEVYRLIELVGAISPPRHTFVPKGSTIAEQVLNGYPGDRVVIKLVSSEVVHKSESGAVVIVPKDLERVRAEIDGMVARHAGQAPIAGTLVVEFIEHDARGLGTELFVGIRATREFGPVIAAGLGGVQTEYLAAKMLPGIAVAKAVATDTDAEEFLDMFRQTVAYDILAGQIRGGSRLVSDRELLRCFRVFISIARQFCIDRGMEGPDIGELEVNPFAFFNQHLVPLDGRGRLRTAAKAAPPRSAEQVDRLLEPKSIAMVGVSSKPDSFGRIILGNVLAAGFDPARLTVVKSGTGAPPWFPSGVRLTERIEDLEDPADLLIVTAPASAIPEIVEEANASGKVRSAIMISGGAGETEGSEEIGERIGAAILRGRSSGDPGNLRSPISDLKSATEEEPDEGSAGSQGPKSKTANPRSAVFLGPNCMGVQSRPGRYDTFFVPAAKLPPRRHMPTQPLAIVSQSGAFIVSRLSSLSQLSPAFTISIGNQSDVTVSDLLWALDRRGDVQVAAVYLEGFANLDGLETLRAVEHWVRRGKTVVFYKAGRTESGRSAAAGHTAAVAGDYDICQTAMRHAGALVANDFREFSQLLEAATLLAGKKVADGRIFAVTNAGMEAVGMADCLSGDWPNVRLDRLGEEFEAEVGKILGEHRLDKLVSRRNPLDLTPMASEAAYAAAVRLALNRDEVDAVIVSCVPLSPTLHTLESELDDPGSFLPLASEWAKASKPVVFVVDSGREYDALAAAVQTRGVPVFRSADEAMRRLAQWIQNRLDVKCRGLSQT